MIEMKNKQNRAKTAEEKRYQYS